MRFDIVTIFPNMFDSVLGETIIRRAREKGLVEFFLHDIRDHAKDRHRSVDDTPYGGGAGMVMIAGPLVEAVEAVPREGRCSRILLTPQGEPLTQPLAKELSSLDQIVLTCGRYEGIDERARELVADREISVGDYVLSGGEIAAMVLVDAVVRLVPGVLGNEESPNDESFEAGLLEYPQYTRPETFRGETVPAVLLSGNHAEIRRWRRLEALRRTRERRPDLFEKIELSDEDQEGLALIDSEGVPRAGKSESRG
ncbi:MAG: tRNA (guanosine(37)-N1)-methyltransferase TrmD [Proteobacteria bacterium]|nr:tRNA (guanosine(37)-N1)-methyltransferase TrmD [Pseudomonadota bacterium]